ncbi:hypothetical protein UFOVP1616_49 [uncultured Caudovirales phage]|uniref:Uncharacterized protein n=1 Tax=uncultured Caudovirales phage TaxID=2100421 RepID=A0A6J5SLQ2_9CAUD|nr:hypothetical protein UFOVP1467_2 [uncultured Caudovirales phage]CAB4219668.1 hypothetical protein UFOVP1616_49 [uncultured Caudovirales phage]
MEKADTLYTIAPDARVLEKSGTITQAELLAAGTNIQALLDAGTLIAGKSVAGASPVEINDKKGSEQ